MKSSYKFSLWVDFIERDFLKSDFKRMIAEKIVNGATSNPAIFRQAITSSRAYLEQKESLKGRATKDIYEALAIQDIQEAATIMEPLYNSGDDGYVSIEVDPHLCDDAKATIDEGKRLYAAINRPNVMIKVPATEAGYEAMEVLISEGIAVNATLIFSLEQALSCAKAFKDGAKKSDKKTDAVISVFVSRFDRKLDSRLGEAGIKTGLTGIYNAAKIYNEIEALGLEGVRLLFASTGVKGDEYPPSHYIDELLAPNSINTAPIDTIDAFLRNRVEPKPKLPISLTVIENYFEKVAASNIDMSEVASELMHEGLESFKDAFDAIMDSLK